jgi:hypothetical protein
MKMSEEEEKTMTAMVYFYNTFGEYIKDVDPVLWERAKQYALDCYDKVPGVELIDEGDPK